MESYSASSSSAPLYFSSDTNQELYGHRSNSLRSVRKSPGKPWKKPVAAPVPTRVYKVDRMNFQEVVQQLTGAPDQSRRLQRVAPPPLDLAIMTPSCRETRLVSETQDTAKPWTPGSLELCLSPISYMWCSLPLLSPGTLSIFEPETVL